MDNFRRITGFPEHKQVTPADETKLYGIAISPADGQDWIMSHGSCFYTMGIYHLANIFDDVNGTESNVMFYELNDDLVPVGVIHALSFTAEQSSGIIPGCDRAVTYRDLTHINREDGEAFNQEF